MSIRFARDSAITAFTLDVEASGSLAPGTWTPISRSVNGQPFVSLAAGVEATETGTGAVKEVTVTSPTAAGEETRFLRSKEK